VNAFIDEHRARCGVEPICTALQVAPSAYWCHAARQRNPALRPERAKRDALLLPEVRRVFDQNLQVYGADKVWRQLHREGLDIARCTVERLMRLAGLRGARRGKSVRTTVPDAKAACPLDRVNRQFKADRPNQLWVADFTYVSTWQGFVYVAFVVDVFARYIVGWRVSTSMQTDFVLDALEQALYARRPEREGSLVHHSDRGSQGEFNPSSQHVLIGGVDELEEVEVGSIAACEAPFAGKAASVASSRAGAVLESDFQGALQRGRGRHRWSVAGRRQQMVSTMRRYATIESCAVRTRAVRPLRFLR
jgi:putative transposase